MLLMKLRKSKIDYSKEMKNDKVDNLRYSWSMKNQNKDKVLQIF